MGFVSSFPSVTIMVQLSTTFSGRSQCSHRPAKEKGASGFHGESIGLLLLWPDLLPFVPTISGNEAAALLERLAEGGLARDRFPN